MCPETEAPVTTSNMVDDFRRRLGTLDPQQVAIWRQMTPARTLQLLFQMWHFARKIAWTTERQSNPDASPEELAWRILRRMHGTTFCATLKEQMAKDGYTIVALPGQDRMRLSPCFPCSQEAV